ncbi:MAG: hypothetical protein WA771_07055 [Chthoniobacterales bacterium]
MLDDREDGAGDQVPVLSKRDRDDGLEIQRVAEGLVVGATAKIEVVLERDADERGDGVLKLLREIFVALGVGSEGRREQGQREGG